VSTSRATIIAAHTSRTLIRHPLKDDPKAEVAAGSKEHIGDDDERLKTADLTLSNQVTGVVDEAVQLLGRDRLRLGSFTLPTPPPRRGHTALVAALAVGAHPALRARSLPHQPAALFARPSPRWG